ncbi:MAG: hypothetical protein Tp138OMZ00d2C19078261_56 [Prokaryotic dsDNA virus sp.]|jgi:hypothetical protein|nr:MAG: hypothetical protein Tp138OMZ00d2C19078261_56 [Prokaryotic dsDNA virus sp.]|tara:strand:- start:3357 stop:3572 length:216 start_codon:yes stop_codon:yes gene_type:complete
MPIKVSEAERRRVQENRKTHHRVKISHTANGRYPIRVDGEVIMVADNHLEARTMKNALLRYLDHLDMKAGK